MKKRYIQPMICMVHLNTVSMIAATTFTIEGNNASVESTYEEDGYVGEFSSRSGGLFEDE